jgi:hypothetical protein
MSPYNKPELSKKEHPWVWEGGALKDEQVSDWNDRTAEKQAAWVRAKVKA